MKKHRYHLAIWLAFAAILNSCSHRNDIKAEATPDSQKAETPKILADSKNDTPSATLAHYIVKRGDCLWRIAAKSSVLGDPFRWPLLYKQNRDEIENPDLIEPRQELSYERHYSSSDIASAVKQADQWPEYVPPVRRSGPLPVKD